MAMAASSSPDKAIDHNSRNKTSDDTISLQTQDLERAFMDQEDFDLAYRLQLEEALAASSTTEEEGLSAELLAASDENDRLLAFSVQRAEISRCQQQASDLQRLTEERSRIEVDLKRRAHDFKFARYLNSMGDGDWESHGDFCEDPFEDTMNTGELSCKLYTTAVSSRESHAGGFAIGGLIKDLTGNVLIQLQRHLESETSKTVADYMGLIAGLETALSMGQQQVEAYIDSVLVYNTVTRRWRARCRRCRQLLSKLMDNARQLKQFHVYLIPRTENHDAVRLGRETLNAHSLEGERLESASPESNQVCMICLEGKHSDQMFSVKGCGHTFCRVCIIQHAEVKVQSGQVPVRCPQIGCQISLGLAECQAILSQKWFNLLNKCLIEVNMPESERVYCPFPKCSALMNKKDIEASHSLRASSSSTITVTMCVECNRMFCLECRVPWHTLMSCYEYQHLAPSVRDAQDAELYRLAENHNWKRCQKCRRMIELLEGCYHMTCRCGYEFCYLCGKPWKDKKQTCGCRLWDESYLLDVPLRASDDDEEGFYSDEDTYDDSEYLEDDVASNTSQNYAFPNGNPYYKTKICTHWQRGYCQWEDRCNFAHGLHELR